MILFSKKFALNVIVILLLKSASVRVSSSNGITAGATGRTAFELGSGIWTSPSYLVGSQRSLPAIRIDKNGKIYTAQIFKQQLANDLGLSLRDLRVVDPSFPTKIQATFVVRQNAILLSLEKIKVVIKSNEALIFSPFLPETQEFIPVLQQQVSTCSLVTVLLFAQYSTLFSN